jgi:hypothetical protein
MPAWTAKNISFVTEIEEGIGWRIGQLRQRMGVAPGKEISFWELLLSQERTVDTSPRQTKPPYIDGIFLPPSLPVNNKKKTKGEKEAKYISGTYFIDICIYVDTFSAAFPCREIYT